MSNSMIDGLLFLLEVFLGILVFVAYVFLTAALWWGD